MDGPCVSVQDLISGEKNGVRGGAWSQDKRRELVSVQISRGADKGRYGERADERERKSLRLDKGQNGLTVLVVANTNRPLFISLYLLRLQIVFYVFSTHLSPLFPLYNIPCVCFISFRMLFSSNHVPNLFLYPVHIPLLNHLICACYLPFIPL